MGWTGNGLSIGWAGLAMGCLAKGWAAWPCAGLSLGRFGLAVSWYDLAMGLAVLVMGLYVLAMGCVGLPMD